MDDADRPPLMITRFVIVFPLVRKRDEAHGARIPKSPRDPSCRYPLAAKRSADDSVSVSQALPLASAHWPRLKTLVVIAKRTSEPRNEGAGSLTKTQGGERSRRTIATRKPMLCKRQ